MNVFGRRVHGYLAAVVGVAALALVLWPFYPEVRGITVSSALLLVIVLVAVQWGMGPAVLSAVLSLAYLTFVYFEERIAAFEIQRAPTEVVVALFVFLTTSVLVGQLSSRAQRRAREIQELYDQLRAAFDRASQLEAIKHSERFKSALLDTVTHDLRTPLTSIKAAATSLLEGRSGIRAVVASQTEERLLRIIVDQCDRLNRFIDSMIELASIESAAEAGDADSAMNPTEEAVAAAISRAEAHLGDHNVVVECEESLAAAVNPKAVAQVIFSLLENAARFAPPGTAIRVLAGRDDAGHLQIAVEDEGPGVPPELRSRIFEKFFRADAPQQRSADAAGLGLGLAIARGIVEAHGGRIWVEDRLGGGPGARFVFVLPVEARVETGSDDPKPVVKP